MLAVIHRYGMKGRKHNNSNSGTYLSPSIILHGESDIVLPPKHTHPDVIVSGAGHALSISHGEEVTRFLKEKMKQTFGRE